MTRQSAKSRTQDPSATDRSRTVSEDGEGADSDVASPDVSRDRIFDALKNNRRRLVLRHLHDRAEPVTVNDLVEHVAAVENDTTPAELTDDQRKRVYVGLYQSHLPRLDDMEFVEFEQDEGTVALGPAGPILEQYLYVGEDAEDWPWFHDYAAFGGLTFAVLSIAVLTGLVTMVGAGAALAGISVGIAGLTAYRLHADRE